MGNKDRYVKKRYSRKRSFRGSKKHLTPEAEASTAGGDTQNINNLKEKNESESCSGVQSTSAKKLNYCTPHLKKNEVNALSETTINDDNEGNQTLNIQQQHQSQQQQPSSSSHCNDSINEKSDDEQSGVDVDFETSFNIIIDLSLIHI